MDKFQNGVIEIAQEAIDIVDKITAIREKDMEKIQMLGKRSAESSLPILRNLYKQPIVNNALLQKWTGFTRSGTQSFIKRFIKMGILIPKDEDKTYGQIYVYKEYLDVFIGKD